jgi:hypothetical protein
MTKVLISGHSVGQDFGICDACGFDHEWLLRYPSVILWVEKILLTKSTWNAILNIPRKTEGPFHRSIRVIFELMNSAGLLEIIDPTELLPKNIGPIIISSVEYDLNKLAERFPDTIKVGEDFKKTGQIFINKDEYCSPYLHSVYASLLIARILGAQCLFNSRVMKYCNYKFGLSPHAPGTQKARIECFHSVFENLFPNEPLLPEYSFWKEFGNSSKTCDNCIKRAKCSDSYLATVESQTEKAIRMRNYEEIEQARSLINKIIEKKNYAEIDPHEVKEEFLNECKRLSLRNRKVFSKVKYWCSLSMMVSVPLTVTGISTQTPSILAAGAATLGLATGFKNLMDALQEKYRWTAYFNKNYGRKDNPFYLPPP